MITIPLELRAARNNQSASAFLIPSGDPSVWVDILVAGGLPADQTRLFTLPTSHSDVRAAALLVVPAAGAPLKIPQGALAYTCSGGRFFHPVESSIFPPVSPEELSLILTWDINVFHPGLGLIGYRNSDARFLTDLIAPPARRSSRWNLAVAGNPPPHPFTTVEVERSPSIEILLDRGRDDIATRTPRSLPRAPGESMIKPMLFTTAMIPLLAMGKLVESLRSMLGRGKSAGGSGPLMTPHPRGKPVEGDSAVTRWLLKMLSGLSAGISAGMQAGSKAAGTAGFIGRNLTEHRLREIHRLLKLLKDSPDEGLRHAIPMTLNSGSRGLTTPGATLTPCDLNFSLSFFMGGRPADPWHIPGDLQGRLREDYRRLANRELNLGRFSRAAYIFAQLLGDLPAAASALKQGRMYREAATLFREKLNQPREAAECLEEGGLLTEAIEIYESFGQFEKVGDLYMRLEQQAKASEAYRKEVNRLVAAHLLIPAAVLLEKKLCAPDEALATLDSGWPGSSTAPRCLEESFALRGRLARHSDTARQIANLGGSRSLEHLGVPLTEILSRVAKSYPDAEIQALAADATRVLAGNMLKSTLPDRAGALVRAVISLDPADCLLARDGQRFLTRVPPRHSPHTPSSRKHVRLIREFSIGAEQITWCAAFSLRSEFWIVGHSGRDVVITRSNWHGGFGPMKLTGFFLEVPRAPHFIFAPEFREGKIVKAMFHETTTPIAGDWEKGDPSRLIVGPPTDRKTDRLMGLCADDSGVLWTIASQISSLALTAWDMTHGMVRFSQALDAWLGSAADQQPFPGPDTTIREMPIVSRGDHLFFALRHRLVHLAHLRTARQFDFADQIISISVADPLSRTRVAVVAPHDCRVITADGREFPFADGMQSPLVTFTRGGTLVARDEHEVRLYRTESERFYHERFYHDEATRMSTRRPLAIIPTDTANQFAVIEFTGNVQIFEITT